MRRMIGALVERVRRDERGVSLVFITITLVLIIGMAAFAIDAGALYQEKRELQNGADAGAIAIAEDCAAGVLPCTVLQGEATADDYADFNAKDGAAAVDEVQIDLVAREVTVTVSTERIDGGTIFSPFFARVLGFDGMTVEATASAAWGFPKGLATIPLIISDCEWERETGSGVDLHDGDPPYSGDPSLLFFHSGTSSADDCAAVAGQDTDGDDRLPGGFGWLDTDGDCAAVLYEDDIDGDGDDDLVADEDPGASPSTGCSAAEFRELTLNKVVYIPWFDDVDGLGANGRYRIAGFGAIYVTGYNFGGQYKEPSAKDAPCKGDDRCLEGYFVKSTSHDGDFGGEDRGVRLVKFTG